MVDRYRYLYKICLPIVSKKICIGVVLLAVCLVNFLDERDREVSFETVGIPRPSLDSARRFVTVEDGGGWRCWWRSGGRTILECLHHGLHRYQAHPPRGIPTEDKHRILGYTMELTRREAFLPPQRQNTEY